MNKQFKPLKSVRYFDKPIGYGPRTVTFSDLTSSPMKEAIQEDLTPFFIKEVKGAVFVCNKTDKIQMLELLIKHEVLHDMSLYFVWPGKYQSHVFEVERGIGLVHKMLSILNGEDERKKGLERKQQEVRTQISKLIEILEEMEVAINE